MNTIQLINVLEKDQYTKKFFIGVVPRDMLPNIINYPACLIVNTHDSSKPGEHWLALFYDRDRNCEFFDSYGQSPEFYELDKYIEHTSNKLIYNSKPIQGIFSNICGYYSLLFLYFRSRGISMKKFVNYLRSINHTDYYIKKLISKYN